MKKLAEFAKRVQAHLNRCPISEDDVMGMIDCQEQVFDWFAEEHDMTENDYYEMNIWIDEWHFSKSKDLLKSILLRYHWDEDECITTDSGGNCAYVSVGVVKVYLKATPKSEFELILDKYPHHDKLITNFLKSNIDFEKTIGELRNVDNMWDENIYLNEPSTSEYDESTFEKMLLVMNICDRKQKLTEILTE